MDEIKTTFSNGSFIIWKNKKYHSEYGPARVTPWNVQWYIDGVSYSPEEWAILTNTSPSKLVELINEYSKMQRELSILNTLTQR